jgi:hypothetical protein
MIHAHLKPAKLNARIDNKITIIHISYNVLPENILE